MGATSLQIPSGFHLVSTMWAWSEANYPPMIRTIETAEILDTSLAEVRRLLRDGKIFGFKLGDESAHDHWRVLTDSVFEYRDQLLSESAEPAPIDDVE